MNFNSGVLVACCLLVTGLVNAQSAQLEHHESFAVISNTSDGWHADATNSSGALGVWVISNEKAKLPENKTLTLKTIKDSSGGVFNLFWTPKIIFQDGELQVSVRANTGEIDQGGGLIWRVQDANNYYIARFNPLEDNFRLYFVKQGRRVQLATAENLPIKTGDWFDMRIAHHGHKIQGWLNNKLAWEVTDSQFNQAGGIGLWTKADAASSFNDLVVRYAIRTEK